MNFSVYFVVFGSAVWRAGQLIRIGVQMARKKLKSLKSAGGRRKTLYDEIYDDTPEGILGSLKRKNLKKIQDQEDEEDESAEKSTRIGSKASAQILKLAVEQLDDVDHHEEREKTVANGKKSVSFALNDGLDDSRSDTSETEDSEGCHQEALDFGIDPTDEEFFKKFAPSDPEARSLLSDLVMKKLDLVANSVRDREEHQDPATAESGSITKEVSTVYERVGTILSRYKSGRLPKVFTLVPLLSNWRDIIYLTRPDQWTPQATYMAVKIFIEKFEESMTNFFIRDIILAIVRDDIQRNKKLNYHLYKSIKKMAYRPAGLFKGIVIPLCASGTCTLREAAIVASIIYKISIPMLHSAACILKLASLPYSGASSLFIRVILDKKYALPYKVIDSLVDHYVKMQNTTDVLPVLWHQSLLTFCQRYKNDLLERQKKMILTLIKTKHHRLISQEIRRELTESIKSRDIPAKDDNAMDWNPTSVHQKTITFSL